MNNIVIVGILFVFAIIIARVAWNNKLKYSYTDAEIGAKKQENLKDLQQLTNEEVLAVDDGMHQAGRDVIKRNVNRRLASKSVEKESGRLNFESYSDYKKKRTEFNAHMSRKYGT